MTLMVGEDRRQGDASAIEVVDDDPRLGELAPGDAPSAAIDMEPAHALVVCCHGAGSVVPVEKNLCADGGGGVGFEIGRSS